VKSSFERARLQPRRKMATKKSRTLQDAEKLNCRSRFERARLSAVLKGASKKRRALAPEGKLPSIPSSEILKRL
jgi:hypothetical protein